MPDKTAITITVNGNRHELTLGRDVLPSSTLSETLRDTLGYLGVKIACDHGSCGACTVILNGESVLSCTLLTVECDGAEITTIEGLENPKTGELHPLQQAFIDETAFQCGFCTPGIILTVKALLDKNPNPGEEEVKEALAGNYCRCISHYEVLKAVSAAIQGGTDGK